MNRTILLLLIGAVALSNCRRDNDRPARRRPASDPYYDPPVQDYPAENYAAEDYPAENYAAEDYPAEDYPAHESPVEHPRPERRRPVAPRKERPQYASNPPRRHAYPDVPYREQDPQYQFDDISEPAQVQPARKPAPVRRRPATRRAPRPAQRPSPRPVQRPAPRPAPRQAPRPERRPARRPERPVEPVEEPKPAPYQSPVRSQQSIRPNQLPIYNAETYKGEAAVDAIGHSSQKGVLDLLNSFYDIDPEVGIIGKPDTDFPTHAKTGKTDFSCSGRSPGYYADVEKGCQQYYSCGPNGNKRSFLCVNGTIFNQRTFTCAWWYDVNCADSEQNYFRNDLLHVPPKESSESSESSESYESYEDDEGEGYDNSQRQERPARRRPAKRQEKPRRRRPAPKPAQRQEQTQYDDEDHYQY